MKFRFVLILLLWLFLSSVNTSPNLAVRASGQASWPDIGLTPVAEGLDNPVHITNAGDGSGRLFVVEQQGRIRIIKNNTLQGTFLDISDRVRSVGSEEGLLSVAFQPGFGTSQPYFYVYYTRQSGNNRVSRFTVSGNPNQADPASETTVLKLPHPTYQNHNGGQLAFGPDGYLYIGTGDGGGGGDPFGNAQDPGSLLGKLLRIDVSFTSITSVFSDFNIYLPLITKHSFSPPADQAYVIPPDNPFVDITGYRAEIWALGLRNPWRFSFDRLTGDLYIGDVGQSSQEEVDFQSSTSNGGENYGWNIMEGTACYNSLTCNKSGLTLPVFSYQTHVDGCAISGGYVYRGSSYPGLEGIYFAGDYCSGKIWGLRKSGSSWENQELRDTSLWISSFGEDEGGEIYLADRSSGSIYQLIDNNP